MGSVSSEAIDSALKTIRARLSAVERQFDILASERDALRNAEKSLLAIIAPEMPSAPLTTGHPPETPATSPLKSSLRDQLYAALKAAGPEGRNTRQLREQLPEAKKTSIAATLSALKGAGLIDNKEGAWFCRKTDGSDAARGGGSQPPKGGDEEPPPLFAIERDYEVFTDVRTGVTLARRA